MRGHVNPQAHMFSYFSPEKRVPAKHPLRSIKVYTDSACSARAQMLARQFISCGGIVWP
jgi:hypothetical protein